jgi:threonine aldolase
MIDLRSDTITQPTYAMRQAMMECEVGDDVYQDDPTITKLEHEAAILMNKPAALFVPSGTMGNQLAILVATQRAQQIITHSNYHIVNHEGGAPAWLSGVMIKALNTPENKLTREAIISAITPRDDIHVPLSTMLCLENPTSYGTVVDLVTMQECYTTAKQHQLHVHLDGARIFNAAVKLNCQVADLAQYCDSLMFCLSKGLCAPVGSILCGTNEFIETARRYRKMLGGGLRQAGFLAAAGLIAINDMPQYLINDHINAQELAQAIHKIPALTITQPVEINMVFFTIKTPNFDHEHFWNYLTSHNIKFNPSKNEYRFVTNHDVSKADIQYVITKLEEYFNV